MKYIFGPKRIYADWAATTPVHCKVAKAMKKAGKAWANPSAIHSEGVMAKRALDDARSLVARTLFVKPDEIFFTSGGTEANCTIIQGVLRTHLEKGVKPKDIHIVSTSIEHSSVLETLKVFEEHGVKVTYVSPKENGIVSADDVLAAVNKRTVLVTCMYANNEIGTIQPVSKIGAGIRKIRAEKFSKGEESMFPIFHTDASQAPMWLACDIEGVRADAMTLDAHKMQGPKGVGALFVRKSAPFAPHLHGGHQERGRRGGTENVAGIVGLARAELPTYAATVQPLRDRLETELLSRLPRAERNGSATQRLPNTTNLTFPGIESEALLLLLDQAGICASAGSACLADSDEPSHVVRAMKPESAASRQMVRFSLGRETTAADTTAAVSTVVAAVARLSR